MSTELWKPSSRTKACAARHALVFLPTWVVGATYLTGRILGWIPSGWDWLFFLLIIPLILVTFVLGAMQARSAYEDVKKSAHPDPDVASLIDGTIDVAEYRRRKEGPSGMDNPVSSLRKP